MCIWIETFNLLNFRRRGVIVSLAAIFQQVPGAYRIVRKTRYHDWLSILNCALLLDVRALYLTPVRKGRYLNFILLSKNHHPLILNLRRGSQIRSVLSESRLKSVSF